MASARPSKIWILVLLALLLLPGAMVAAWFYRRSQQFGAAPAADDGRSDQPLAPPPAVPAPVPGPPVARRPPEATARAQIDVTFRPRRAGTNLTSAAVDYELIVRNSGTAAAHNIRLLVSLVTAGEAHDAELGALFANGAARPIVAPFDLAAGEQRQVKAVAMVPREAINVVAVKGRPMFVPMIAVNVLYGWTGGSGQTARSHVIGITGSDGERMRPFWLDAAQRMHDSVSARDHTVAVRR